MKSKGGERMEILLLKIRKENNLTQEDMAKMLDISTITYRNKELGRVDFKQSEMFTIAKFFNKRIEDIFLDSSVTK